MAVSAALLCGSLVCVIVWGGGAPPNKWKGNCKIRNNYRIEHFPFLFTYMSRYCSVGKLTGHEFETQDSIPGKGH
jgi:hypothetical protein